MTSSLYLLKTIKILKKIRSDLHVNLEASICEELDQAIRDLEKLAEKGNNVESGHTSADALSIIGEILNKIPSIVSLINLFKD